MLDVVGGALPVVEVPGGGFRLVPVSWALLSGGGVAVVTVVVVVPCVGVVVVMELESRLARRTSNVASAALAR